MISFDLIRERYHSDITTEERAFLMDLIVALYADFRQAKRAAN